MPRWTPEQQQAINARNNTILVSAAAGSGKTAVLVERIVQLIREGDMMNRMLIVTFTKAAASEMRQRLKKRLVREAQSDQALFGKALDDLETTEISTIHAFCQKVLRNHFQTVGIDPLMRVCDDQMKKALFDEAWLEALNQLLEENDDQAFLALANTWEQQTLHDMTEQLYDFLMSLAGPFDWFDHAIREIRRRPYTRHRWFLTIKQHCKLQIEGISHILQAMDDMFHEEFAVPARMETLQMDIEDCEALMQMDWNSLSGVIYALQNFSLGRQKAVKGASDEEKAWMKRFGKLRDDIKGIVNSALDALCIDEDQLDQEFEVIEQQLKGISSLAKRTHQLFRAKKLKKNVIDFADMEQYTMEVLADQQSRKQLQSEFDHIFVDECQDVSQVQDAILQSIHSEHNCMFMVGDVKQSIYRFRKADPTLFLHRMRTYHDEEDADNRRIFLQKNFRSRSNVLEATNQVFRKVMRPKVTELEYLPEDELICGRETQMDPPVEMHLLDISPGEDGEKPEALAAEAKILVSRIEELLETYFDDGEQIRTYTYRDMVILLSAAANTAPKLVEMLTAKGIPVFYDGAGSYFDLPEIRAVKALLSTLDNPLQDIPMLSVLKTPPFSLTDDQLAEIRTHKTGRDVPFYEAFQACCEEESELARRCQAIRDTLEKWRFEADTMRLSDFIWHLIDDSGYYASCGALPKGELRQANLRMLYQRALAFEQDGGETLTEFIQLTDQQAQGDDRISAKMLGEGENLVRIMTMHKSKGLEFPVVFCMQMSGKLHKPGKGDLLLHPQLGAAMPYVNRAMNIKRKTMADDAFRIQRELDEKAERARLLYVAMTRARERLIMIGCCTKKERSIWTLPESDYRVWKASSMTDWLMQSNGQYDIHKLSTDDTQAPNPWNVTLWDECEELHVDNVVDKVCIHEWIRDQIGRRPEHENSNWSCMDKTDVVPLKTSVSAIAKKKVLGDPLPLSEADEDIEDKRAAEEIVAPLRLSEIPAMPAFLQEKRITGADRGTLVHRALSLIPLDQIRASSSAGTAVHEALHDMMAQGIFTAMDLLHMDVDGIVRYLQSEIGMRMLESRHVRREWSFNLVMDEERGTLLQGVIDCAFIENDQWILMDYKTDRIMNEDAFRQRYALQVEWYARALEKITGKPVKEAWLYSISKGKAYLMERQAV